MINTNQTLNPTEVQKAQNKKQVFFSCFSADHKAAEKIARQRGFHLGEVDRPVVIIRVPDFLWYLIPLINKNKNQTNTCCKKISGKTYNNSVVGIKV